MNKVLSRKYYLIISCGILTFFILIKISNLENINFLYGDDNWVVIGSQYKNFIDKLMCCSITYPGISLIHQFIFQISPSTEFYLKALFSIACLFFFIIASSKSNDLDYKYKLIFLCLLLSSPMLINYSIRAKPYIYESIITFTIFLILNKSIKKQVFKIGYLYLFLIFVMGSIVSLIPLFAFFLILVKNRVLSLRKYIVHYLFFSFVSFLVVLYGYLKKGSELNEFWISYYAPTEGGVVLFLRWVSYSLLRILGESNKLDLGASSFSIIFSIFFITMGFIYLIKNKSSHHILEFIFIIFFINLILSIMKIFPFGGSRVNIYYMILVIYMMTLGIKYCAKLSKIENAVVILSLIFIVSNLYLLKVDYLQTTRYFDQQNTEKIIKFVNETNEETLIYHGGIWTIGAYSKHQIVMEEKGYQFTGSGVGNVPVPIFISKENLHTPCKKYNYENYCKEIIKSFLNDKKFENIFLISLHTRDYQYLEYLNAFEELGYKKSIILSGKEAGLVQFNK